MSLLIQVNILLIRFELRIFPTKLVIIFYFHNLTPMQFVHIISCEFRFGPWSRAALETIFAEVSFTYLRWFSVSIPYTLSPIFFYQWLILSNIIKYNDFQQKFSFIRCLFGSLINWYIYYKWYNTDLRQKKACPQIELHANFCDVCQLLTLAFSWYSGFLLNQFNWLPGYNDKYPKPYIHK